jgi:hypothetical protein
MRTTLYASLAVATASLPFVPHPADAVTVAACAFVWGLVAREVYSFIQYVAQS